MKVREPNAQDNKYTRGVVTMITGSDEYPGAALLGVGGALAVGIGMVRYLGASKVSTQVIQKYPEVVLASGKTDCVVAGSGRATQLTSDEFGVLSASKMSVIDAGCLQTVDLAKSPAFSILTPHFGEFKALQKKLGQKESGGPSRQAAGGLAKFTDRFVLLKGSTTYLAAPDGQLRELSKLSPWLSTAGSGDILAGMLGALMASYVQEILRGTVNLLDVAELAVRIHSEAAELASHGGPVSAHTLLECVGPATLKFLE